MKICLSTANTLTYPQGGYLWIFLNWALGLQANGCQVMWLDAVEPSTPPETVEVMVSQLRDSIGPYGFADSIVITSLDDRPLSRDVARLALHLDAAADADLLLNLRYDLPADIVSQFHRSAAVDIDPGILQFWMQRGIMPLTPHDLYFTIGENIGINVSDAGLRWHHTFPCVSLDRWPIAATTPGAAFTTVSHWIADEWMVAEDGYYYKNDKRSGFEPFLDIPTRVPEFFELALDLDGDLAEQRALEAKGWRVREAHQFVSSPADFERYVQASRGEFSCCKPAYAKLQTCWLSDRTPCYLACGKPCVVQHTGASHYLPDAAGLFRFRDLEEAIRCLKTVERDYERQCKLARSLAEEYFDAKRVVRRVLERALA